MDVSPKTLREVEFRDKLKGYNPDDVDEFLERVAAGIEILQERLRQATERAVRAEQKLGETTEADDAMRRTLVLAQRTADAAVAEARQEAQQIVAAAQAQGQQLVAAAEDAARRTAEEAQRDLWNDLATLETARDQLRSDIAALDGYLLSERSRLYQAMVDMVRRFEADAPAMAPAPTQHEIDLSSVRRWGDSVASVDSVDAAAFDSSEPAAVGVPDAH